MEGGGRGEGLGVVSSCIGGWTGACLGAHDGAFGQALSPWVCI